jgi:hypothetical protein
VTSFRKRRQRHGPRLAQVDWTGLAGTCPANGKLAFETRLDADAAAVTSAYVAGRHGALRRELAKPLSVYRCDRCGWWHLTSRQAQGGEAA